MRRSLVITPQRMRRHARRGQGLVEYALILVLIAVVVIGILGMLGGKVEGVFSTINSAMPLGAGGGGGSTFTVASKSFHCSNGAWVDPPNSCAALGATVQKCRVWYNPSGMEMIDPGETGTHGIASCP